MGERDAQRLDAADRVYRRWARARLKTGTLVGWVAETPSRKIVAGGCLWLQPVQPRPGFPGGGQPYLLSLSTDPAHRGRGLARRIVQEAVRWAKKNGYPRMTLHASREGRRIYARLGFSRTWEMRLDLRKGG